MKYIHLNELDSEVRLREARDKIASESKQVQGRHTFGHTSELNEYYVVTEAKKSNASNEFWRARRGSNSRPIDSKSIALSN